MKKLKSYFQTTGFSGESLETIANAFTVQTVKKNDLFVEEGKVSKYLAFVDSGLFQYYFWMIWKGLNLRIGAIAMLAEGHDVEINPTPGISYSFFFQ